MSGSVITFDLDALRAADASAAQSVGSLQAAVHRIRRAVQQGEASATPVAPIEQVVGHVARRADELHDRLRAYDTMAALLETRPWFARALGTDVDVAGWLARVAGLADSTGLSSSDADLLAAAQRLDRDAAWFASRGASERAQWLALVLLVHRARIGNPDIAAGLIAALEFLGTSRLPSALIAANAAVLHALQEGLALDARPNVAVPIAAAAFAACMHRSSARATRAVGALDASARLLWVRAVRLAWVATRPLRTTPPSAIEETFAALHAYVPSATNPSGGPVMQWLGPLVPRLQSSDVLWSRSLVPTLLADVTTVTQRLAHNVRLLTRRSRPAARPFTGTGNLVVGVGGLGSSWNASDPADRPIATDMTRLGYAPSDVSYFSYRAEGGSYGASDSYEDLEVAAQRLADQLRALHSEHPDRAVDLIGHSQGGVVEALFLARYYDAADPTMPRIEHVLALGAPLQGAPLADAAQAIDARPASSTVVRSIADAAGIGLPPRGATSVRQLGTRSAVVRAVADLRVPEGVKFQAIAGTDDYVVPASAAALPGQTAWTINPPGVSGTGDHTGVAASEPAYRAMRRALNNESEPTVSAIDAVRNAIEPVVLARAEATLGMLDLGRAG